jgi:hypothetical protein
LLLQVVKLPAVALVEMFQVVVAVGKFLWL